MLLLAEAAGGAGERGCSLRSQQFSSTDFPTGNVPTPPGVRKRRNAGREKAGNCRCLAAKAEERDGKNLGHFWDKYSSHMPATLALKNMN